MGNTFSKAIAKVKKAKRQASHGKIIFILMKNLNNAFHVITCHNIVFPWSYSSILIQIKREREQFPCPG